MAEFFRDIVRSEIVTPKSLPALESGIAGIARLKDSWFPEAVCLVAAALWQMGRLPVAGIGTSAFRSFAF